MNGYEKIINLMREQSTAVRPEGLKIGEMDSPTDVKIGEIKLEKDDYLISKILTNSNGDKATSALKKGDIVLVQKMSDELYVIIERLVSL